MNQERLQEEMVNWASRQEKKGSTLLEMTLDAFSYSLGFTTTAIMIQGQRMRGVEDKVKRKRLDEMKQIMIDALSEATEHAVNVQFGNSYDDAKIEVDKILKKIMDELS